MNSVYRDRLGLGNNCIASRDEHTTDAASVQATLDCHEKQLELLAKKIFEQPSHPPQQVQSFIGASMSTISNVFSAACFTGIFICLTAAVFVGYQSICTHLSTNHENINLATNFITLKLKEVLTP
jgi:hypothetical protein